MPELWLNYGAGDAVLDIGAENLEGVVDSGGQAMEDAAVSEIIGTLDTSRPADLVLLHYTEAVRRAATLLFAECERRSHPIPRVLAERRAVGRIRSELPEGSVVLPLERDRLDSSDAVFLAEIETDGLFGYETVSTRLLRRFGGGRMLAAYSKRKGDAPAPGEDTGSALEASDFVDGFDARCVEIAAGPRGITGIKVGHPSKTASLAGSLGERARRAGAHRSVIISTGNPSSSETLAGSLKSLWGCCRAVRDGGLAVLMAECGRGVGSEALRRYVEERLAVRSLRNPARYVDGMEDVLFLSEVQKRISVGMVSVLPDLYTRRLGMSPLTSARQALERALRGQGAHPKVLVAPDGARTLLL